MQQLYISTNMTIYLQYIDRFVIECYETELCLIMPCNFYSSLRNKYSGITEFWQIMRLALILNPRHSEFQNMLYTFVVFFSELTSSAVCPAVYSFLAVARVESQLETILSNSCWLTAIFKSNHINQKRHRDKSFMLRKNSLLIFGIYSGLYVLPEFQL